MAISPPDLQTLRATVLNALSAHNATEIAELLEINATAVHMRLSRARQRLAERLTAQGVISSHE